MQALFMTSPGLRIGRRAPDSILQRNLRAPAQVAFDPPAVQADVASEVFRAPLGDGPPGSRPLPPSSAGAAPRGGWKVRCSRRVPPPRTGRESVHTPQKLSSPMTASKSFLLTLKTPLVSSTRLFPRAARRPSRRARCSCRASSSVRAARRYTLTWCAFLVYLLGAERR